MRKAPAPKNVTSLARDKKQRLERGRSASEFWNQFKTDFAPGTHLRIHPLLDWTELNVWEYIERENIPTVSLYYDQGDGTRYRSLGCWPCTNLSAPPPKTSGTSSTSCAPAPWQVLLRRSGRAQDKEDGGGLETLRRDGYM